MSQPKPSPKEEVKQPSFEFAKLSAVVKPPPQKAWVSPPPSADIEGEDDDDDEERFPMTNSLANTQKKPVAMPPRSSIYVSKSQVANFLITQTRNNSANKGNNHDNPQAAAAVELKKQILLPSHNPLLKRSPAPPQAAAQTPVASAAQTPSLLKRQRPSKLNHMIIPSIKLDSKFIC